MEKKRSKTLTIVIISLFYLPLTCLIYIFVKFFYPAEGQLLAITPFFPSLLRIIPVNYPLLFSIFLVLVIYLFCLFKLVKWSNYVFFLIILPFLISEIYIFTQSWHYILNPALRVGINPRFFSAAGGVGGILIKPFIWLFYFGGLTYFLNRPKVKAQFSPERGEAESKEAV